MARESDAFNYSYSAREQAEVRRIREKYAPPTESESRLERLRRLDASATRPGRTAATVVGAAGTLLLGVGMSCTMVWTGALFVPGIVIGVIGIACIAAAPVLYKRITKRRRELLAPEILRLTDELSAE